MSTKKPAENCCNDNDLGQSFKDAFAAQWALSKEIVGLVAEGAGAALGQVRDMDMPTIGSGCEIPEPCWMPKSLGEVTCQLCGDGTGTINLIVTNEDFRSHDYLLQADGEAATAVHFPLTSFTLGPKERRCVPVTIKNVPRDGRDDKIQDDPCCPCPCPEALIWVRGCNDHYLRVEICDGKEDNCCHTVAVDDRHDYVVHWYDHFYCAQKPCFGRHGKG